MLPASLASAEGLLSEGSGTDLGGKDFLSKPHTATFLAVLASRMDVPLAG